MLPKRGKGMAKKGIKGLEKFISDIRNCKSKEDEVKRINKELTNIRSKFNGDKPLDGYQKKKYVCKLLFIFLLGHDIEFGHTEAVNLLCSNKFTEKQIAYLFISLLMNENHPLIELVCTHLEADLCGSNPVLLNLALQLMSNIGGPKMAERFANAILLLIFDKECPDYIRQTALLCMKRFVLLAPNTINLNELSDRVLHFLNDKHLGVVIAAVCLISQLVKIKPDECKDCVPLAVSRLCKLINSSYTDLQDYSYYFVPAPWLSCKLLCLLQNYPPPEDPTVYRQLIECIGNILKQAGEPPKSKRQQHLNAVNCVLLQAISLSIHLGSDQGLIIQACSQLFQFLQRKELNMRYLALEFLCLLATNEVTQDAVRKNQSTVVEALKTERDVSVRQRAADLLYAMCGYENARDIVREMLAHLESADYAIREEMVLKVAILAEKYATDYLWYVDTILNLIRVAGDYVGDEVWYRVIHIVGSREDVQGYAAKVVFQALQAPACHENMVKVGAYILGEFGNLIAGDASSSPINQFQLLHSKFHLCQASTRHLLLSTYIKFVNLFPELKADVQEVFRSDCNIRSADVETQQRSVEYLKMTEMVSQDVLAMVLEEMPPFPERQSNLLAKLNAKNPENRLTGGQQNRRQPAAAAVDSRVSPSSQQQSTGQQPRISGNSAEVDLLGLGISSGDNPSAVGNKRNGGDGGGGAEQDDFIADLLADSKTTQAYNNQGGGASMMVTNPIEHCNKNEFVEFLSQPSGYLFQSAQLQVWAQVQFHQSSSRLLLYYRNASDRPLVDFTTRLICPDAVIDTPGLGKALSVTVQPGPDRIEAGMRAEQMVEVECYRPFDGSVTLVLAFTCGADAFQYPLLLPVTLATFTFPTVMERPLFTSYWRKLSQPIQQCQENFPAKFPMNEVVVKNKLTAFGSSVLEKIDDNPNNFVGACILKLKNEEVGILCRLEPDYTNNRFTLTIRSKLPAVAFGTLQLLKQML